MRGLLSQASSLTISRGLLPFYLRRWGWDGVSSVRPARDLCFEGFRSFELIVVKLLVLVVGRILVGFLHFFYHPR